MEICKEKLEALKLITETPNLQLNEILSNLETKENNYILNIYNKENNEISRIIINISKYNEKKKKIHAYSSIISSAVKYFKKSLKNKNIKYLLIFFTITHNLNIPFDYFLKYERIKLTDCAKIKNIVFDFLKKTRINLNFDSREIKYYYNQAIKNENISEIYNYLLAKQNEPIHLNFLLNQLIRFLIIIDFGFFKKSLTFIKLPHKTILFLDNVNDEKILKLNTEKKLDKWMYFELLRQIIQRFKNKEDEIKYIHYIEELISKLYNETTILFFNQIINYFRKDCLFNNALGLFLTRCSYCDLEFIVKNYFNFSKDTIFLKQKNELLKSFKKNANKKQINFLLILVYHKWYDFIQNLNNQDVFCKELILSDYCDYILQYYLIFDNKYIIEQLYNLLKKIVYIDSEWFSSLTSQFTQLFIYLTEIYLISFAYNYKNIKNNKITNLFLEFKENKIYHQKFSLNNIQYELNRLEKNLS